MKIKCLHGYFLFDEVRAGEISDFISMFGISIVRKADRFVFEDLALAPTYSIEGAPLLNTIATETFEGEPWDVLRANGLVYNFDTGLLVPITSIRNTVFYEAAGNYYLSPGLIMPGSLTEEGTRVTEYAAWFSQDTNKFKYSEVTSE